MDASFFLLKQPHWGGFVFKNAANKTRGEFLLGSFFLGKKYFLLVLIKELMSGSFFMS